MIEIEIAREEDAREVERCTGAGLHGFNEENVGPYGFTPIVVAARDEAGALRGGVGGGVHLGWLSVEVLWVDGPLRGQGVGSRLLECLEAEARRLGATRAYLDTMSFQAEGFYRRQGYVEEGRLRDFAGGHDRIYMTKRAL